MDQTQITFLIGIGNVIVGIIGWFIKKLIPWVRKAARFLDLVIGVPADPEHGQKEVVGLFARMDHQDEQLAEIHHEVFPNSGGSLRDAVDQQGRDLKDHIAACPPATTTINVNPGGVT